MAQVLWTEPGGGIGGKNNTATNTSANTTTNTVTGAYDQYSRHCTTPRWSSYAPYVRLSTAITSVSTDGKAARVTWKLTYHTGAAGPLPSEPEISRCFQVRVGDKQVHNEYHNIAGIKDGYLIKEDTIDVERTDVERTIECRVHAFWELTVNGYTKESNVATLNMPIPAADPNASGDGTTPGNTPNSGTPGDTPNSGTPGTTSPSGTSDNPLWIADWSADEEFPLDANTATSKPPKPSVSIEDTTLTITVDVNEIKESTGYDDSTYATFEVVKDDTTVIYSSNDSAVTLVLTSTATDVFTLNVNVELGHRYKVRCQTIKIVDGKSYLSKWSDWSDYAEAAPLRPEEITVCRSASSDGQHVDSIYLEWPPSETAKTYEIQYVGLEQDDTRDHMILLEQASPVNTNNSASKYMLTDLGTTAKTYYIRVRAVGKDTNAKSDWSNVKVITLGSVPEAPTTFSSRTVIAAGDQVTLYWVHNSTDESSEEYANINILINGIPYSTPIVYRTAKFSASMEVYEGRYYTNGIDKYICIQNGFPESLSDVSYFTKLDGGYDENEAGFYVLDTSEGGLSVLVAEGATIKWEVATAGLSKKLGDWSIQREITVYAKPTMELEVTDYKEEFFDILTAFPISIYAEPKPAAQKPIGYYLSIKVTANGQGSHVIRDAVGNPKTIHEDDIVYYRYFDINQILETQLSAGDVNLANNITYTLSCIASLDSGLTVERTKTFKVGWTNEHYLPTATMAINNTVYAAAICPYCEEKITVWYKVDIDDLGAYQVANDKAENGVGVVAGKYYRSDGIRVFLCNRDGTPETLDDDVYFTKIATELFVSGMEVTEGMYYTNGTDTYLSSESGTAESLGEPRFNKINVELFRVLYPSPLIKSVRPLGKNLADGSMPVETHNCDTFMTTEGELCLLKTGDGSDSISYIKIMPMYLTADTTYCLSYKTSSTNSKVIWYNEDLDEPASASKQMTFKPTEAGYYSILFYNDENIGDTVYLSEVQVEVGTEATAYEPYQGVDVIPQRTFSGQEVYYTVDDAGNYSYYCPVEESRLTEDVLMSVYRRNYDGSFTEISKNKPNTNIFVTDPHPALDYARYRIVAMSTKTGAVSYYDLPSQPVGCKSVIIQWDEDWNDYHADKGPTTERSYAGSMLSLPYNIDVTDKRSIEVEMVKYVGRQHPVSYYGTHLGETASWSCEIPKTDKETLYELRRLAAWAGDVYVREPSGVGYWAHILVNFSQKHLELTVPVSFEITRVEGGT